MRLRPICHAVFIAAAAYITGTVLLRAQQPSPLAYVRVIGDRVTLIKRIDPFSPDDGQKSPSYIILQQESLKPAAKNLIDAMNEMARHNGTANCAGAGNRNEIVFSSATGSTAAFAIARAREVATDYLAPDAIMECAVWPEKLNVQPPPQP